MKRDYSTFVTLPQKTSIHISIPANIFKQIIYYRCIIVKDIQNYFSANHVEQFLITRNLCKLKLVCDVHSIFKYC